MTYEREKRGLTQKDLAEETGIEQSSISHMERGRMLPFPGWRDRLEKVFKMPVEELLKPIEAISEKRLVVKHRQEDLKDGWTGMVTNGFECRIFCKKDGMLWDLLSKKNGKMTTIEVRGDEIEMDEVEAILEFSLEKIREMRK